MSKKKRKKENDQHFVLRLFRNFFPWTNWLPVTTSLKCPRRAYGQPWGDSLWRHWGRLWSPGLSWCQFMPFQWESTQVPQSVNLAAEWETAKSAWNVWLLVGRHSPFFTLGSLVQMPWFLAWVIATVSKGLWCPLLCPSVLYCKVWPHSFQRERMKYHLPLAQTSPFSSV